MDEIDKDTVISMARVFNTIKNNEADSDHVDIVNSAFRYNSSSGAGFNFVVFEWEVDLTRIIARGNVCHNCNCHKIILEYPIIEGSHRENDSKKITNVELGSHEVISTHSGYDKK